MNEIVNATAFFDLVCLTSGKYGMIGGILAPQMLFRADPNCIKTVSNARCGMREQCAETAQYAKTA